MLKEEIAAPGSDGCMNQRMSVSSAQLEAVPANSYFETHDEAKHLAAKERQAELLGKLRHRLADPSISTEYQLSHEHRESGTALIEGEETPTLLGAGYIIQLSKTTSPRSLGNGSEPIVTTLPPRLLLNQFKMEKVEGTAKALFTGIDLDMHMKKLADGKSLWISEEFIDHLAVKVDPYAFTALADPIIRAVTGQERAR